MVDSYREFYELAGRYYPEDQLTYSSLSGIIRKKWVFKKLAEMPPGKLLDCGCNIGRLSAIWKKGEVYGIDISFSLVSKGKRLFPEINFIHGDIRSMEFLRDNSIDNVIAIEVIEHLDRVDDFLHGIFKVLKNNGLLLITTPGYSHKRPQMVKIGVLKSFGIRRGVNSDLYLHTAYKPEELRLMLEKAGFAVLETGSFEFELRGWVKPFTILKQISEVLAEKYFPYSALNILITRWLQNLELNVYYILDLFGFGTLLRKFLKQGRRSFVMAKKP